MCARTVSWRHPAYSNAEWEKLSIFLNFLVPKLPAPIEEDLSKGILEAIDMDSYRAEMRAAMDIALEDEEGAVGPVPASGGGYVPEPELDLLSNIVREFNDLFGNIDWKDADKMGRVIAEEIGQSGVEHGLPECHAAFGQAERAHRA